MKVPDLWALFSITKIISAIFSKKQNLSCKNIS